MLLKCRLFAGAWTLTHFISGSFAVLKTWLPFQHLARCHRNHKSLRYIFVSWSSVALTVPSDILTALPPQGHSWAASRTNISIIDKAESSQRQVLTFSLQRCLFQCLFRAFQVADIIPAASLSVRRSHGALSTHHRRRFPVKRETSEWHLCNTRAGTETRQRAEHPEFTGEDERSPQNQPPAELRVGLQSWCLGKAARGLAFHPLLSC